MLPSTKARGRYRLGVKNVMSPIPATTTVQVVRLATDPRCLVEINAIAIID